MIEIGKINKLTVTSEVANGFYLSDGDNEDVAFISRSMAPGITVDQIVDAFLYVDNNDSVLATLQHPRALLGEYALMSVVDTVTFGAFFDWGISKDLLVPDTEQKLVVRNGEEHIVRVCLDERTRLLYGTTKLGKYIQGSDFDIKEADKVEIVPSNWEELGYRCIINKKYIGMIYHNEIFSEVEIGTPLKGVVKKIRPDGLIDAALQVQGIRNLTNSKEVILGYLEAVGGKSPLNDKSSPDDIREALSMSKQTFKNTIGMLYKARKIKISKDGIELVK
jgi:predicted RNA-binding protein (virulence factor B family)